VTIPALNTYRILWVDAAGEGRFTDLQATSEGAAAWTAATDATSSSGISARFIGMIQLVDSAPAPPPPPAPAEVGQAPAAEAGQGLNPLGLDRLPDPGPAPEATASATGPAFPYGPATTDVGPTGP
jgi:hypothetical protein